MDIVDPLDTSNPDLEDTKIIINNLKTNNIDSDEEQIVEHLAPQTVLQTQDSDVQYSIRSPEGSMITYRVLQVDNGTDSSSQYSTTSTNFLPTSSIPQVISGTNINGQIYVIGSPTSYTSSTSTARAIAPRPTRAPVLDASVVVQVKKKDERRRATHNEVERRRRDKINNWIAKLAKILPEKDPQEGSKGNGQYDGHSKGGILAKAFEYINELQITESRLNTCLKENKKLTNSIEQLKQKNFTLESENKQLREILKKHGVETCNARKS